MRYLEGTPANVALQNARLYALWEAEQRAARGLRAQDSLDVETSYTTGRPVSRVLPLAEARTTGANGYARPIVAADNTIAAVPLDDYALAQQGRGGVDVRGHKEGAALDARIQAVNRVPTAAPIGMPRPR